MCSGAGAQCKAPEVFTGVPIEKHYFMPVLSLVFGPVGMFGLSYMPGKSCICIIVSNTFGMEMLLYLGCSLADLHVKNEPRVTRPSQLSPCR